MVDYIGPTASLLEGNTRASTAKQDREAQRGMKNQELLQSSSNAAVEQQGATDRTVVQSKQAQLLENLKNHATLALENLKLQEESKLKEKELKQKSIDEKQKNYFTMTPNTVKGIKDNLGIDFKDLQDQEVHKDIIMSVISAKYKTDIAELTSELKKHKDATGETKDLQKELDKLEGGIKSNRDKLFGMSLKDLPQEVWDGGKPGDMRALIQNVSKGKLGKLDPAAESQIKLVAGYINTMKSQQERANKIHEQLHTTPTDYTGMGLEPDAAPGNYKTKEEVIAAFKGGQLDRAAAKKILADSFGIN